MKRIIKSTALLVMLTVLVAGVAFAGDMKMKCQEMSTKIAKAILENDHKTIMDMYEDGAYSLPSYSPMLKGKKAMAEHQKMEEKMGIKMKTFSLTTVDVLEGKDFVVEIGTYKLTMTMPGMEKPFPDHGKFITVWKKHKDGSMKVVAETWNTDVNPMAQKH